MTATTTQEATPEHLWARALEHDQTREQLLAELAALESQAGAVMLDDPDAAGHLTETVAKLRTRADLEARAASEGRKRSQATHVAHLRAQAEEWDPQILKARRALAAHDAKRAKRLAALEEFTGFPWIADPPIAEGGARREARPREALVWALESLVEQRANLVRQADTIETNTEWEPPAIRAAQELREEWERTLSECREVAADIPEARARAEKFAAAHEDPRNRMPHAQERVKDMLESVADSERYLQGFPEKVKQFRARGLDLSDAEVSALVAELASAAGGDD